MNCGGNKAGECALTPGCSGTRTAWARDALKHARAWRTATVMEARTQVARHRGVVQSSSPAVREAVERTGAQRGRQGGTTRGHAVGESVGDGEATGHGSGTLSRRGGNWHTTSKVVRESATWSSTTSRACAHDRSDGEAGCAVGGRIGGRRCIAGGIAGVRVDTSASGDSAKRGDAWPCSRRPS